MRIYIKFKNIIFSLNVWLRETECVDCLDALNIQSHPKNLNFYFVFVTTLQYDWIATRNRSSRLRYFGNVDKLFLNIEELAKYTRNDFVAGVKSILNKKAEVLELCQQVLERAAIEFKLDLVPITRKSVQRAATYVHTAIMAVTNKTANSEFHALFTALSLPKITETADESNYIAIINSLVKEVRDLRMEHSKENDSLRGTIENLTKLVNTFRDENDRLHMVEVEHNKFKYVNLQTQSATTSIITSEHQTTNENNNKCSKTNTTQVSSPADDKDDEFEFVEVRPRKTSQRQTAPVPPPRPSYSGITKSAQQISKDINFCWFWDYRQSNYTTKR